MKKVEKEVVELTTDELDQVSGGLTTFAQIKMTSTEFTAGGAEIDVGTQEVTAGGTTVTVPYVRYKPPM